MRQTEKGKQWYFRMKADVGVDRKTKIVHSAVVTAANMVDDSQPFGLLRITNHQNYFHHDFQGTHMLHDPSSAIFKLESASVLSIGSAGFANL